MIAELLVLVPFYGCLNEVLTKIQTERYQTQAWQVMTGLHSLFEIRALIIATTHFLWDVNNHPCRNGFMPKPPLR